jgi:hypothetical protein
MLNSLSNASMKRNVSSRRVAPGTAGFQSILNPCNTDLWYHNTIVIRKYKRLFVRVNLLRTVMRRDLAFLT